MTLTTRQIAKRLQVSPDKVLCWIYQGCLPAVDVSQGKKPRYRILEQDFHQFLETRKVVPVSYTTKVEQII